MTHTTVTFNLNIQVMDACGNCYVIECQSLEEWKMHVAAMNAGIQPPPPKLGTFVYNIFSIS